MSSLRCDSFVDIIQVGAGCFSRRGPPGIDTAIMASVPEATIAIVEEV